MEQDSHARLTFSNPWDMAVVVRDIDNTVKRLEALGIGPFTTPQAPSGAEGLFFHGKPLISNSKALITRLGDMQLEVIQPDDKPNPWKEFLNARGEGIHHIGFQVNDVEKEVNRLTSLGAEVPFFGKINGKIGAAYMDLKIANIFVELTSFSDMEQDSSAKLTFTHLVHIGVVVRDMNQTIDRLNALGLGPFKPRILPSDAQEKYRGKPFIPSQRVAIQTAQIGSKELELIQPIAGESPHREFLDQKGEGIQHLGFIVDNLEEDINHLTAEGSSILLTSQFKGGGGVAYLDLDAAGLIVELVQPGSR